MPRSNPFALVIATAFAALEISAPALDAYKPERTQEGKIRGADVALKAGWQLLFHDSCRFAVPASWHANGDGSLVLGPDGSNLSVRTFKVANWSTHKAQIKAAFGQVNLLHEDSDRRLWFEIGDRPRVQHYIDVVNGQTVCSSLLEIRANTIPDLDETVRRIVESIGPA
jgi:hypothetical protein